MNDQAILVRRYFECTVFVILWMAIGFNFHLGPIAYQLLGLPLIVAFQLAVARRPLVQLWARDADSFRLDRKTWLIAGGLLVALFLVDEVAFRGALDPHIEAAGSGRVHAWSSAIFVSILWSAWHFPAYYPQAKSFLGLFTAVGWVSFVQIVFGPPLSFCARPSRTLAPSAAIHAFGNAYVLALAK